jgi:adenine C2-methylase RlmN of 23S rRNA A2503 and tRNA A37
LSTAQIVEQLVEARRYLAAESASAAATNIVFMGMGALVVALPCCAAAVACLVPVAGQPRSCPAMPPAVPLHCKMSGRFATCSTFAGSAGEPFDYYEAVMKAIEIATHPLGLHFSKIKITVSTVGLVPQIRRFARTCSAQLAVSLHAPNDALRSSIVPVNRRRGLRELVTFLR